MKKCMTLALSLLMMVSLLAACGDDSDKETEPVDLAKFYSQVEKDCGWEADYMAEIEGDLLEDYYPGLSEIPTKQLLAKTPELGDAVNELVFLECESEADAEQAAAIFQERIDYQVGDETNPGGAMYPEFIEPWKQAEVIRQGAYVALVASAEAQDEIVQAFQDLFA